MRVGLELNPSLLVIANSRSKARGNIRPADGVKKSMCAVLRKLNLLHRRQCIQGYACVIRWST